MAQSAHSLDRARGFTLLELLVVVSIMVMAMLAFATVIGSRSGGPALERHAATISGMVANIRQNSAVRKVHSEIVFDHMHDRVVALARRRLVSFALEDEVGSGDTLGKRAGGATFVASRSLQIHDGKCLELPFATSSFTVGWQPHFDVAGDYEGVALAFDYFPLEATDARGLTVPVSGGLASMGSVFSLSVIAARTDCVRLALSTGGVTAFSSSWIATVRWHRVEIAVSRYGVSLWIDGRLDEGLITTPEFAVSPAAGQDLRMGGTPCRIDNLELFSLISSQSMQLEGCQFIVPDTDPMAEATGKAESIFIDRMKPASAQGPITGQDPEAPEMMGAGSGLPNEPVPAIVHVYFDTAGKLDPGRHAGAVDIYMISYNGGDLRRMVITFHPLGVVTFDYVDRFFWEKPPDANAPGGGG